MLTTNSPDFLLLTLAVMFLVQLCAAPINASLAVLSVILVYHQPIFYHMQSSARSLNDIWSVDNALNNMARVVYPVKSTDQSLFLPTER